jgi:hypothetical protein
VLNIRKENLSITLKPVYSSPLGDSINSKLSAGKKGSAGFQVDDEESGGPPFRYPARPFASDRSAGGKFTFPCLGI